MTKLFVSIFCLHESKKFLEEHTNTNTLPPMTPEKGALHSASGAKGGLTSSTSTTSLAPPRYHRNENRTMVLEQLHGKVKYEMSAKGECGFCHVL